VEFKYAARVEPGEVAPTPEGELVDEWVAAAAPAGASVEKLAKLTCTPPWPSDLLRTESIAAADDDPFAVLTGAKWCAMLLTRFAATSAAEIEAGTVIPDDEEAEDGAEGDAGENPWLDGGPNKERAGKDGEGYAASLRC